MDDDDFDHRHDDNSSAVQYDIATNVNDIRLLQISDFIELIVSVKKWATKEFGMFNEYYIIFM